MVKMIIFMFERILLIFHKLIKFYEHFSDMIRQEYNLSKKIENFIYFLDFLRFFWEFLEIKIIEK